jgi:hypothetical protein
VGKRPFLDKSIVELERLFQQLSDDFATLRVVADELAQRKTQRARALAERVDARLGELGPPAAIAASVHTSSGRSNGTSHTESDIELSADDPIDDPASEGQHADAADRMDEDLSERPVAGELPPEPAGTLGRDPAAILEMWTALEVLSPQTYLHPRDLADGDLRRIAKFGEGRALPWVTGPEKARPKTKLYYQVVLGAIAMDGASTILLKAFGDKRPERSAVRGYAALAAVTVDREGRPVAERPVAVSSFGWGYKLAREGRLHELETWPAVERKLTEGLEALVKREEDDEVLPLDEATILAAHQWLCARIGLPELERIAPSFAIRIYRWFQASGDPEPMLLNSFYLEDLGRARTLHGAGSLGPALARYLGLDGPARTTDLLENKLELEAVLAPARTPPARWPTPGGHSLVLLQQAAVNVTFQELGALPGLVGVNGPPGTGKTTLLRDLVAGAVLERARVLATYEDPESAFVHRGKSRRGQSFRHLYEIAAQLRGHEVLVASSNNKAVENISRELPGLDAIEATLTPDYFPTTAAAVAGEGRKAWGLIAGVLGNAANRVAFRRDFWADKDNGLQAYLWTAAGNPPATVERTDPDTGATDQVIARVVTRDKPPRGKDEALARWKLVRRQFQRALTNAETGLRQLEAVRQSILARRALAAKRTQAERSLREATERLHVARAHLEGAKQAANATAYFASRAEADLREHNAKRPGLIARLLRRAAWAAWKAERVARETARMMTLRDAVAAREALAAEEREVSVLGSQRAGAQVEFDRSDKELAKSDQYLSAARGVLQRHFADEAFWKASHAELQTSTPWLADEMQRMRDICFKSALEVHRAFIDVAAKPIRNNLNALFGVLMGDGVDDTLRTVLPSLWTTLFLVVPVLSTTFASVGRMLGPMPPQSLGWLLVDEAGQAVPQAAVGALMRARRATIVGDPLQIEPVVTLPLSLVERIARRMSVDPEAWSAPLASAQTLADAASRYQSWIEQLDGSVRVGAPLLVHRRCAQPMFGIANAVAYAGKMVQATPDRPSRVRDVLGPAKWLHVTGNGYGKWCPEEGRIIIEVLRQLVGQGLSDPDVFVITPFRIVAQQMRELLAGSDVVSRIADRPRDWARERVGTIHTFQGREAEAVFLVLGAPDAAQNGARNWAGHPPNLANVAVSRAKDALYVVGNRELWRNHGSFRVVSERLAH